MLLSTLQNINWCAIAGRKRQLMLDCQYFNALSICEVTETQNVQTPESFFNQLWKILSRIQNQLTWIIWRTAGLTAMCRCYRKEQTFCGLNGLLLDDMPVSSGSCWACWRQNFCRSAAAWDTCWRFNKNQSACRQGQLSKTWRKYILYMNEEQGYGGRRLVTRAHTATNAK